MELLELLEENEINALKQLSTQLGMKFNTLIEVVTNHEPIRDNIGECA